MSLPEISGMERCVTFEFHAVIFVCFAVGDIRVPLLVRQWFDSERSLFYISTQFMSISFIFVLLYGLHSN